MTWPAKVFSENWIDWSWFQNNGWPLHRPFNVDQVCAEHPEIEGAVIRFVWPSGAVDEHYAGYFDGFKRNGKMVAGYGWANPKKAVPAVMEDWKRALGDRIPLMMGQDYEETATFKGSSKGHITATMANTFEAARREFPDSAHIGYARGNWLDTWITPGEWFKDLDWWLAHWIWPPPDFRDQAEHWSEIDAILPIDNDWTPNRGRLVTEERVQGWQISEHGDLVPRGRSDMSYFKKAYTGPIYGQDPPPDDGEDPPPDDDDPVQITVTIPESRAVVTVEEI